MGKKVPPLLSLFARCKLSFVFNYLVKSNGYTMQSHEYTDTEERIFKAALEEFSEFGRAGARMQSIAERAGITKALVHYYFRSKDRLYDEVFSYVIRRYLLWIFQQVEESATFEQALRTLISRYLDLLESNPWLPKFMLREVSEGAPVLQERLREQFPNGGPAAPMVFIRRFMEAVEKGEIRPLDPLQTMFTVLGSCIFFYAGFPVFSALVPQLKDLREQLARERADHVYDIIMHGLLPSKEKRK